MPKIVIGIRGLKVIKINVLRHIDDTKTNKKNI